MSSILVANANADYGRKIAAVLRSGGLYIGGVCTAGAQAIDFARKHYHGGVVVTGVMLRDMPATNLPRVISGYDFLFLVNSQLAGMVESLEHASLILPVNRRSLISTVNMFLNISDYTSLGVKRKLASEDFDEKKTVEKAKNLLIERNHFTEARAHRFLQKKSMDTGKKMAETALIILESQ